MNNQDAPLAWGRDMSSDDPTPAASGAPLARYAPHRRAGDLVLFSGVIPVDGATGRVVRGYADLPPDARRLVGETGEVSVDAKEGPALCQSYAVLDSIRRQVEALGGEMADVVKLVQYFRDLRDFPLYNRVRKLFYPGDPPASTVVQVSAMLPSDDVLIEVEATAYLPEQRGRMSDEG
ncbi:MAG: RidA family protein [Lacipirellulaceae bacterium]